MTFAPSLERLARAGASDFTELQAARDAWSAIFAEDFDQFDTFYELITDAGNSLVDAEPHLERPHAFTQDASEVFLLAASDTGYLRALGSKPAIQLRLAQHNETIVSLIRELTAQAPKRPGLARSVGALIALYFHHGDADDALCSDVVSVIPDALMSFPGHTFPFGIFLLKSTVDAAETLGRLVAFHVVDRGDVTHQSCLEVADGALGPTASTGDRLCQLGSAILGQVAKAVREKRPDVGDDFVTAFALRPLDCDARTRGAEIARLDAEVSRLRSRLSSFEEQLKSPVPATAQDTPLVLDIARASNELERVRADFDAWMDERRALAVRHIAAQPTKRATLEAIHAGLAPLRSAELERLLSEAAKLSPSDGSSMAD